MLSSMRFIICNFSDCYIELFGKEKQPDNVPQKIYLQVRHLSGSYFRAGDNTIKQYHQPVGSFKNIKFNRFTLSNETECKIRNENRKDTSEW